MIYFDNEKWFAVKVWPCNEVVANFEVYETYVETDGTVEFHDEDGCITSTTEEATPYLRGAVKWDKCVNYEYPAGKDCMLHACGETQFDKEREMWKQVYRMSRELIGEKWYE